VLKDKLDVAETNLNIAREGAGPNLAPINIPSKKMVELRQEYEVAKNDYLRAIRSLTEGNIKEYESKGSIGQFFSPMSMTPAIAPSEIKKFEEYKKIQGMNEGGGVYPNEGLESLAKVAPEVVARMGYNMGGYVMPMAYATGGDVAVEDFDRKNGFIEGPGTETSDDVPAMLSDGEFVMTGAAVRGAGTYNMENNNGIVTLTPSGEEDRKKGTDLMYEMMGLFESYGTA
jgi:hypothetical protein